MESGHSNTVTENQKRNHVEANYVTPSEKLTSSSSEHGKPYDGSSSTTDDVPFLPTEVMVQLAKEESSARIPSSVFERSDTATPAEWSVASNESLFSIHMGNLSFTKDQLNYMNKSGELGYPYDSYSSPLRDFPNNNILQSPHHKSAEIGIIKASDLDAASMRGMLKDNSNAQDSKQPDFLRNVSDNVGSISQHSDKSFAFPILAGGDSCHKFSCSVSPEKVRTHCSQPSNPKVATETMSSEPPTSPVPPNKEQTPNKPASQNCGLVKWFSWFPCCASR